MKLYCKRIFVFVLALCILIGMPFSVNAQNEDDNYVTFTANLVEMKDNDITVRLVFSEPVALYYWRVYMRNTVDNCAHDAAAAWSVAPYSDSQGPINKDQLIGVNASADIYSDTYIFKFPGCTNSAHAHYADWANGLPENAMICIEDRGEGTGGSKTDGVIGRAICAGQSGKMLKATGTNNKGEVATQKIERERITFSAQLMDIRESDVYVRLVFSEPVALYYWRVYMRNTVDNCAHDAAAAWSVAPYSDSQGPINKDQLIGVNASADIYSDTYIFKFPGCTNSAHAHYADWANGLPENAMICIEDRGEGTGGSKTDGVIGRAICAGQSGKMLKATGTNNKGEVATVVIDQEPLTVTATQIAQSNSDVTVQLKFSEPVALYYWRLYMGNTSNHCSTDEGVEYGALARSNSAGPMNNNSYIGSNASGDIYSDTYVFTFPNCSDTKHIHYSKSGLMENAVIRITDTGEKTKNDSNTKVDGFIGKAYCVSESGKQLQATGTNDSGEVITIPIMPMEEAPSISITEAYQVNKKQMRITFSEAVSIKDPYMALRLVDEKDVLIYAGRNSEGVTERVTDGSGKPVQWPVAFWEWNNEEHTEILVTFDQDVSVILDASQLPASISPYANPEYKIKFSMIETYVEEEGDHYGNGLIGDVTAAIDESKKLKSTGKAIEDGAYIDITNPIAADTLVEISDAKITGENELTFRWSQSVELAVDASDAKKNYHAAFRYVNENGVLYKSDENGWVQIPAILEYTSEDKCEMTARIRPNNAWSVNEINDMMNPKGKLKEFVSSHAGKWVLSIEESGTPTPIAGNGIIESFFSVDGTSIQANPFIGSWNDGVYANIVGDVIVGNLKVTKVEIISDINVKVSFSAPIQIVSTDGKESPPWVSMRLYSADHKLLYWNNYTKQLTTDTAMYDADGKRIYENQNGYTYEKEGFNAQGKWVNYAAMNNVSMQWASVSWKWGDDAHTSIIYTLSGGSHLPAKNFTEILSYDFSKLYEGCYIGFDIEENTPAMITYNGHVDNIVSASNSNIALDADFFPHSRDSIMVKLEDMIVSYQPGVLTASAKIISASQIRVSFSKPVDISIEPHMAIRLIDKNGDLVWYDKKNESAPMQWTGTWEWENDTRTSLIWTINANGIMGGGTIYNLVNWEGALQRFSDMGTWMFCIEELDKGEYKVGRYNGLIDNIVSKDGLWHLKAIYSNGLDGALLGLNTEDLVGDRLELLSATAIDDQTIKLVFSEPVNIASDVSMGVRYLSKNGNSDVFIDGRTAYFKGDWVYADDSRSVVTWTLNSKYAKNLTDIINFNGDFVWNEGARVAFVIMDSEENQLPPAAMTINGIYDNLKGYRHLSANFATEEYPMAQLDIDVQYDIPSPERENMGDSIGVAKYTTNYIPFIGIAGGVVLACLAVAIVTIRKSKKQ